jgi:methionyl-tRNA synthetase
MREMAFGQDASYSDEAFIERVNTDLANDLGNLASRALKMIEDYCGGALPAPDPSFAGTAAVESAARAAWTGLVSDFRGLAFNNGLARVWDLVGVLNRFIVQHEPWKMHAHPARRRDLDTILYDVAEGLRIVAVLLAPVIPESARRLHAALGAIGDVSAVRLDEFRWGVLKPGAAVSRGAALFPRIDKAAYLQQAAQKERDMSTPDTPSGPATPPAGGPAAGAPASGGPAEITIEDFQRVELRTAKVVAAEPVQGADRLLKLTVDVGTETRTIVAGIAARYAPASLVGKTIIVVANLKPARLRGVVSQGMLLAASDASGQPFILTTEDPSVPAGWRVK